MAIKEFIIGPQNYWEEGYFDGDYTLPNVSKAFLECDIDNIKGGRVVTGLYFQDNYIDGTYWHDNTIRAYFSATADKIKNAQIQAIGYFSEGYYASGYIEQGIAVALSVSAEKLISGDGVLVSESAISTQASKLVESSAVFNTEFNQSSLAGKIGDIDLYAFSNGSLTSDITAIRAYQLDALSAFDIATDYIRQRDTAGDAEIVFNQDIVYLRNRDTQTETQVAFSFDVNETLFKEFDSQQSINAELTTDIDVTKEIGEVGIAAQATISCVISHIHGADVVVNNFADCQAIPQIIRDNASQIIWTTDINVDAVKTTENIFEANITTEFNQVLDLTFGFGFNVIREVSTSLESNSTLNVDSSVIRDVLGLAVNADADIQCVISHIHGADIQAFGDAQLQITTALEVTRDVSIGITSDIAVNAVVERIQQGESQLAETLSVSIQAVKIAEADAGETIQTDLAVDYARTRETQIPDFANQSNTLVDGSAVRDITKSLDAQSEVWAVVGTLESITLIVFNFASIQALPFSSFTASANLSESSSSSIDAVKTTDIQSNAVSSFDAINVINDRLRDVQSLNQFANDIAVVYDRIRSIDIAVNIEFAISAIIGKQEDIDLYAFADGNLAADVSVITDSQSQVSIQFSNQTDAGIVKSADAVLQSDIATSINGDRIRFASSAFESIGTSLSVIDVIPAILINIGGEFDTDKPYAEDGYVVDEYATNFLTIANYIVDNQQALNSQFSVSIDADYAVNGAAIVASFGSISIDAVKTTSTSSTNLINANTDINPVKSVVSGSDTAIEFTVVANAGRTDEAFITVFDVVTLTAQVDAVKTGIANVNSETTLFADTFDSLNLKGEAHLASAFEQTAQSDKLVGFEIQLQAFAFQISAAVSERALDADLVSSFALSVTPTVIILPAEAHISAEFNQTSELDGVIEGNIAISSAMSFVSQVREIRTDDVVYVIPGEGFTYTIAGEGREHDIIGETRVRKITAESRLRTINGESRIYNIE